MSNWPIGRDHHFDDLLALRLIVLALASDQAPPVGKRPVLNPKLRVHDQRDRLEIGLSEDRKKDGVRD